MRNRPSSSPECGSVLSSRKPVFCNGHFLIYPYQRGSERLRKSKVNSDPSLHCIERAKNPETYHPTALASQPPANRQWKT